MMQGSFINLPDAIAFDDLILAMRFSWMLHLSNFEGFFSFDLRSLAFMFTQFAQYELNDSFLSFLFLKLDKGFLSSQYPHVKRSLSPDLIKTISDALRLNGFKPFRRLNSLLLNLAFILLGSDALYCLMQLRHQLDKPDFALLLGTNSECVKIDLHLGHFLIIKFISCGDRRLTL
jgi:hypothetical protein